MDLIGPPVEGIHQETSGPDTILFLESTDSVITLNETGSAVWELCDGSHTVEGIAGQLADAYAVEASDIVDDIASIITQLIELGFLPES